MKCVFLSVNIIWMALVFQLQSSAQVFSDAGLREIGAACSSEILGGSICLEAFEESERRLLQEARDVRQENELSPDLRFDFDTWNSPWSCGSNICIETKDSRYFLRLSLEQANRLRIPNHEHWATQ